MNNAGSAEAPMDWDLCKTFVAVAETRSFAAAARLLRDSHLQLEIITHPFPASVRRREADVVLRPVDSGEENLVGRKIGRLGTGFYASRDYAARRKLPERRDEWKEHSIIGFADRESNAH